MSDYENKLLRLKCKCGALKIDHVWGFGECEETQCKSFEPENPELADYLANNVGGFCTATIGVLYK